MRTADIDRGDLAGARDALNVSDNRAVASSGLDITIFPLNSDLEHPTTPDGAIFGGPFDRRTDGARSRDARTGSPQTAACRQCKYV